MDWRLGTVKDHPLGRNADNFANMNRRTFGAWFREEVLTRLPLVTLVAVALGINVLYILM
jgi:hypothetical protein